MKRLFYLVVAAAVFAASLIFSDISYAAGPLSFQVLESHVGRIENGKQEIIFKYNVRNVSSRTVDALLKFPQVTISGRGRGITESYQRPVDVNYTFRPPLFPGESKTLTTRFWRKLTKPPYDVCKVKIDKYNWK